MKDVTIGLALGVGAARGWAHIGIIQGLVDIGIRPDVVCGTSAGALVGGSYATGHLEELEKWLLSLDRLSVAKFFRLESDKWGTDCRQTHHPEFEASCPIVTSPMARDPQDSKPQEAL